MVKNSRKIKKDRDRRQRTDDLSSVLSDSHGHPDISSICFVTLAFARLLPLALFPLSEIHSSVILSVSACLCFDYTTFASLLKGYPPEMFPNKIPTSAHLFVPFGLGMVGERHCPSKARSNFESKKRKDNNKIPARPCAGRPLTDCALLSLFWVRRRVRECRNCISFVAVFLRSVGKLSGNLCAPCLLFPAVKVYNGSKNFRRYQF